MLFGDCVARRIRCSELSVCTNLLNEHVVRLSVLVNPLALQPERGGAKNLKIARVLVDDEQCQASTDTIYPAKQRRSCAYRRCIGSDPRLL